MPSVSKIRRYRYLLHDKRQSTVTIGDYPAISLTAARERARQCTEIVADGVSPVADARKDRGAIKTLDTVRQFSAYWIEQQMADKSAEYQRTTKRALEKDVYPADAVPHKGLCVQRGRNGRRQPTFVCGKQRRAACQIY